MVMEASSEGEGGKNMNPSSSEGPKKPKRQMKTPFQLEMLEKTYANETYPSEETRAELAVQLDLTDRQLQMWFCHRRLKDKKEAAGLTAVKPQVPNPAGKKDLVNSPKDEVLTIVPFNENVSGSGSGSGSESESSQSDNVEFTPMVPMRYYESPRAAMERRVVACIKAQLGEPLREDGPILGAEFDVLPPGAFGAPIVPVQHQDRYNRHSHDNQLYGHFDNKQSRAAIGSDAYGHATAPYLFGSDDVGPSSNVLPHVQANGLLPRQYGVVEGQQPSPSAKILSQPGRQGHLASPVLSDALNANIEDNSIEKNNVDLILRKRKNDEARIEKEVQANEKKIRKELEKQDLLSKKREEQMRKEMDRLDRERRKDEQRMMREQQRKEEKLQREEKREMERREKFMQKELLRAERQRQKEELRREREMEKQKLALERAAARKIAKESMELIEDEKLELMELAASNKGLPSIVSLDYQTLQCLEVFRDSLCEFPPKSVKMKKPFAVQPWVDSEDNVGKLLLVWRFCLTFADILGLWPCTLDEFIQAFHDYDSRLLGEIHVAVMKIIVKDIEDVARTPTGGPGTNQYSAVNLEGGHPQIVEGAYLWGFDIKSWQKYLNPLTWPEILRQLVLSAGFGPQLKKKSTERAGVNDNDETKGSIDVVSTLRNGSAVENAVAIMHEKGFSLQRKSRHRLTPGTVKFAAYHVLAFEGGKGLNVLDLAEKIQRSGLRDLRSSKTPEASISVALSRDPVLFERIAPSTYCVRPAYRKDPADAETVISEAKDKIQKYLNSVLPGQNVEEEERDDSDSDADGPDIDDISIPSDVNKNDDRNYVGNGTNEQADSIIGQGSSAGSTDKGTEIDESRSGEPWVQGLSEGEYSDLSVEERLNALVALVGIANEGNSVRLILEERLDAANALKKQMWAEAQLDKRRIKEEFSLKPNDYNYGVFTEGNQSPLVLTNNTVNREVAVNDGFVVVSTGNTHNVFDALPASEKCALAPDTIGQIASNIVNQQNGYTAERLHMQRKAFFSHMAEEMYVYRSLPLGSDRRRNRYWMYVASPSSIDPGSGRIFVESPDGLWNVIYSEEAFDALSSSLDARGVRESHLHVMLQKIETSFRERVRFNMATSKASIASLHYSDKFVLPCFEIEHGRNEKEKENMMKRYQDLQDWMFKETLNASVLRSVACGKKRCNLLLEICNHCLELFVSDGVGHCVTCITSNKSKNSGVSNSTQPLRMRMIKAILCSVEASIPLDALQSSWTEDFRKAWALKLLNSSCMEELLQALTLLEGAIKRDNLSSDFETTEELLSYCDSLRNALYDSIRFNSVKENLPWIPQTSAAVALRLFELDASLFYSPLEKPELFEEKKVENFINLSHKYPSDSVKRESTEMRKEKQSKEECWDYRNNTPTSSKKKKKKKRVITTEKGSGGRPRVKYLKGGASASEPSGKKQSSIHGEMLKHALTGGDGTYMHKYGRGPRTVRKRKKIVEDSVMMTSDQFGDMGSTVRIVKGLTEEDKIVNSNNFTGGYDDDNSDDEDGGYYDDDNNAPEIGYSYDNNALEEEASYSDEEDNAPEETGYSDENNAPHEADTMISQYEKWDNDDNNNNRGFSVAQVRTTSEGMMDDDSDDDDSDDDGENGEEYHRMNVDDDRNVVVEPNVDESSESMSSSEYSD